MHIVEVTNSMFGGNKMAEYVETGLRYRGFNEFAWIFATAVERESSENRGKKQASGKHGRDETHGSPNL